MHGPWVAEWDSMGGGRRALGVYAVEGKVWLVRRRGQPWLDEEDLELTVVARPEAGVGRRARGVAHGPIAESLHALDHLRAAGLLPVDGRAVVGHHLRSQRGARLRRWARMGR